MRYYYYYYYEQRYWRKVHDLAVVTTASSKVNKTKQCEDVKEKEPSFEQLKFMSK